jgi:hypothetical protein
MAFRFNVAVFNTKMEEIGLALPANSFFEKQCFYPWWKFNYILDTDFESIRTHFPNATIETIQMQAIGFMPKIQLLRITSFLWNSGNLK